MALPGGQARPRGGRRSTGSSACLPERQVLAGPCLAVLPRRVPGGGRYALPGGQDRPGGVGGVSDRGACVPGRQPLVGRVSSFSLLGREEAVADVAGRARPPLGRGSHPGGWLLACRASAFAGPLAFGAGERAEPCRWTCPMRNSARGAPAPSPLRCPARAPWWVLRCPRCMCPRHRRVRKPWSGRTAWPGTLPPGQHRSGAAKQLPRHADVDHPALELVAEPRAHR